MVRFCVHSFLDCSYFRGSSRNLSQAAASLSSLFTSKSSGLNKSGLLDLVKEVPVLKPQSDVDIILAKIRVGSSYDELVEFLKCDDICNSLQLSADLVDLLLQHFKNDWKCAFGLFKWAELHSGYRHTPAAYDTMVDILGRMKQLDHMMTLLEEMNRYHMVTLGTVAKAIRRLSGTGDWEGAVKLFDELGSYGLEKNTESMNLLLDTLCKAGKVEQAHGEFLKLKSQFAPDASTFNILIHGWSRINQVDRAKRTIQEMKKYNFHPCIISYNPVVQCYCLQGNFTKAYELLDKLETQGPPANVVTYTTIMSSLAKSGMFEEALQVAQRMKSVRCKPDALFYNCLIHSLARTNRLQEAVQVFEEEMPTNDVTPNTSTYNSMIAMFCHDSQELKALKLLKKMESSTDCKPDIQSYYPLLKSCLRMGKIDDLLSQLLNEMVQKHHLSLDKSAYLLLIHRLCKANRGEWAYRLFEEMVGKDIKPTYKTCHLLLEQVKGKKMHAAAENIESIMKRLLP